LNYELGILQLQRGDIVKTVDSLKISLLMPRLTFSGDTFWSRVGKKPVLLYILYTLAMQSSYEHAMCTFAYIFLFVCVY